MMSSGDESVLGAEEDHVCFYDNFGTGSNAGCASDG
jgi:hypothetical protein